MPYLKHPIIKLSVCGDICRGLDNAPDPSRTSYLGIDAPKSHFTPAPWHGLGPNCVVGLAFQHLADFEVLVRQTARTSRNGLCANRI